MEGTPDFERTVAEQKLREVRARESCRARDERAQARRILHCLK
jgi:hypothetical protein